MPAKSIINSYTGVTRNTLVGVWPVALLVHIRRAIECN